MLIYCRNFALLLALAIAVACGLQAQDANSFYGHISDTSGMPIGGATVTIRSADQAIPVLSAVTDATGQYIVVTVPGAYQLEIRHEGFQTRTVQRMFLTGHPEIDATVLQVEELTVSLTVTESPYRVNDSTASTRTRTPLLDVPQSITVVTHDLMRDQLMSSIGDVVRYVPGIQTHQGENNRDQVIIRGNSTSADFFVNGVRDDVQYYRDLYALDRVEALKGPNAMTFGRGGGGGVINRVTKEPFMAPMGEITLQGGSFGNKRVAGDLNLPLWSKAAFRANLMYEDSNTFRNNVGLDRYGVSPTLLFNPGKRTKIVFGFERLHDHRTADRGISSYAGLPLDVPVRTYFGDPNQTYVRADVTMGNILVEHQIGFLNVRNRTQLAGYDRGYQNFVPGAVTADKLQVSLSAYNNYTNRFNVFNQTDLNYTTIKGRVRHTLLGGMELGKQFTDNFRNTGYFNNTATSLSVAVANPVTNVPMTWRQSATDANNHLITNLGAGYIQDQLELTRFVRVVAGLRYDRFNLNYFNNRDGSNLQRIDNLWSPRIGLIFKPRTNVSAYGNYSVSYLPSSGDQFSSLTTITQQVKPEKFINYEAGLKWDISRSFSFTSAVYRLNRTNTRSTDPNDATRIIQTGSTRTNGYEAGVNGNLTRKWRLAGGYSYQNAYISNATTSALTGAQVAQVPHHTFSLWNNYQIIPRLGAGLGIINRTDMFAAVDNTVKLPGYTRVDSAVFFQLTEKVRLQGNVENVANVKYYMNADSNTNISPGSSRAMKIALTARF